MLSRVASRLQGATNPLYTLRAQLESQGCVITDLVSGNVSEHGILFPEDLLEEILVASARQAQIYRPDSFGQKRAREAIAAYYQEQGIAIPAEHILLTPGTSFSYWYCFKLLADEGDEILCPSPSYPLFDYIAALSGARPVPYRLNERRAWAIDLDYLDSCVSTKTRALVLISPHNPTGRVASKDEVQTLEEIARQHALPIISDEVFSEFLFGEYHLARPASGVAPLVFILNGFSKMFALPGIKLGWMAVSGESSRVREVMRALEIISDTFLPVSEIVQASVPAIFRKGQSFRDSYATEIRRRCATAVAVLKPCSRIDFTEPAGGFHLTLRLEGVEEERAAETILREEHLLVHPGYFYDIAPEHLVLSFVQEPETIRKTYTRLVARLEALVPYGTQNVP